MLLKSREREMAAKEVLGKMSTANSPVACSTCGMLAVKRFPRPECVGTLRHHLERGIFAQLSTATSRKENLFYWLRRRVPLPPKSPIRWENILSSGLKVTNLNQRLQVERKWVEPFPCDFATPVLSWAAPQPISVLSSLTTWVCIFLLSYFRHVLFILDNFANLGHDFHDIFLRTGGIVEGCPRLESALG